MLLRTRCKCVGKCRALGAPSLLHLSLPHLLSASFLPANMPVSVHHPFLNSFTEAVTLRKPLLFGRCWARCQGCKENKKQLLFKGSGPHTNCSDRSRYLKNTGKGLYLHLSALLSFSVAFIQSITFSYYGGRASLFPRSCNKCLGYPFHWSGLIHFCTSPLYRRAQHSQRSILEPGRKVSSSQASWTKQGCSNQNLDGGKTRFCCPNP